MEKDGPTLRIGFLNSNVSSFSPFYRNSWSQFFLGLLFGSNCAGGILKRPSARFWTKTRARHPSAGNRDRHADLSTVIKLLAIIFNDRYHQGNKLLQKIARAPQNSAMQTVFERQTTANGRRRLLGTIAPLFAFSLIFLKSAVFR